MKDQRLHRLSAEELLTHFRDLTLSPVEVTSAILERIEDLDLVLHVFTTPTPERAMQQAKQAENDYRKGVAGPLAGVPLTIKDLSVTAGVRTTRGSLLYEDWVADYDAPLVERLYSAGGVGLGKTSTPELGWKGETTNRLVGSTHNPWRYGLTPGGSSGGAAAAVAAGLGPLAQGSDGAGSIRIPASFAGIYGLKPSYGLVPYYPAGSVGDLSHAGPMTRTVRDAALMLNVIAGADARDRGTWSSGIDYLASLDKLDLQGLRIAWTPDLGYAAIEPSVAAAVETAANLFTKLGANVEIANPGLPDPWDIVEIIWSSGMAARYIDNFAEVRDLLDPGLVTVVELGQSQTGAELMAAQARRNDYCEAMRLFMTGYDLLLTPTLPCTAFPVGLDHPGAINGQATTFLGWTAFTYPFNLTGQPAATVPAGFDDGLPVGLQIVGRWHDDVTVLRASAAFEEAMPWRHLWPDFSALPSAK